MREQILWFALHTLATIWIGGILSVLLTGAIEKFLDNLPSRYRTLTYFVDWYGPYVCIVGLVLGFIANKSKPKRVACWVWLSGLAWLTIGIWDSIRSYNPSFNQGCSVIANVVNAFFVLDGHKCGGGSSTLAGAIFTMPALNSIAYSVGAWAAMRSEQCRRELKSKHGLLRLH